MCVCVQYDVISKAHALKTMETPSEGFVQLRGVMEEKKGIGDWGKDLYDV